MTRAVREQMNATVATMTNGEIIAALDVLIATGELAEHERLVRALLTDELCRRCPSVDAAGEQWAASLRLNQSYAETIVAAARRVLYLFLHPDATH